MLTSILSLFLLYNHRFSQTMILSLVLALYYIVINNSLPLDSIGFNNTALFDDLYLGAIVTSIVAVLWVVSFQNNRTNSNSEILALLLLLLIAVSALSSSNHILAIFVGIELQSLALYILLAIRIPNNNHGIASTSRLGISYLINAAIATAMLLLGFSHNSALLLVIALLWKLGSLPVHAWMIAIVDALDISISAIMLTITKLGILISIAIISTGLSTGSSLSYLLLYAAIGNLLVGSLISMQQYRYVRLLSWLSIAQLGYVLLVIHYSASSTAMLYFELYSIYTIMLLLCYNMPNSNISHMHKQMSTIVLWLLALGLYTVAGIPSAPIFWAKLELLLLTNSQAIVVALIGTIISSLVYVRLIKYASFYNYAIY